MGKDSFLIYKSFFKPISKLSDKQLGRLFRAIFEYNISGVVSVEEDIEMAFEFFKNQFDIDESKYQGKVERNRENGRRGGNQKAKNDKIRRGESDNNESKQTVANDSECKRNLANLAYNENEKDNDNDNDNDIKENKPKGLSKKDDSFFPFESVGEFKVDYARVENLWKTICKNLPQIQGLSEKRKLKIRTRLKEMGNSYEKLSAVLIKLNESNFCKGDNNTNWKASFDWLFDSPNNWRKVLEGNYDNKTKGSKQTTNSRLGIGEFIRDDGTRTYGSGKVTIPANAPPRPGERYYWNASNESWAL